MKKFKFVLEVEIKEEFDEDVKNIIADAIEKMIPYTENGVKSKYVSKNKISKNITNKSICNLIRRDIENKKNEILDNGFGWIIAIQKTSDKKIYFGESVRSKPTYVDDFRKAVVFGTEEEAMFAFECSTGFDIKKIIYSQAYPLVQLCTVPVTKSEEKSRDDFIVLVPTEGEVVMSEYIILNYNGEEFE